MAESRLNPRRFMEKAIEVMRASVAEPRVDGKTGPIVGAVLIKSSGEIETACRGELRHGDHAEFTLLERKNRANKLDESILFTTLEPCAPGARTPPKLSCAERILNARIKTVWVGIEDPFPTVDRKGIKFLQDHGVDVRMFDRDLQEEIKAANKTFIAQALELKASAESEEKKEVTLSDLETSTGTATFQDLDRTVLKQYQGRANIPDNVDSEAFKRRLLQQGLLREQGKRLVPSGSGVLLFGRSPRDAMPQAGLLGTIHYSDGSEEVRDFDGPLVAISEQVQTWLRDKLPNPIDRSRAQRQDVN